MMYYGQNKEDELINNLIISKYGSDFKGTILDLGANDGITLSNSRFFIENGWSGVLVEAGKLPYQKLMTTILPNTIAINSAIGNQNGVLTFYESTNLLDANDVGLVSSLVADETTRWRNAGIGYSEYQVECFNWEIFRDKFHLKSQNFDIISIDIEGLDYDVLIQMNLTELDCKVLCVEFNGKDIQKYVDYANKFGMTLVHQNPENLIFFK
jgi:FkbM family methyltransferase